MIPTGEREIHFVPGRILDNPGDLAYVGLKFFEAKEMKPKSK